MISAPGPFVTIRAGGPFDGAAVRIIASSSEQGRLVVSAAWTRDGDPRSVSATIAGYAQARALAHAWADTLAAGQEPEPDEQPPERVSEAEG